MHILMPDENEKQFAHNCIHSYFDAFSLSDATFYVESIIIACSKKHVWDKQVPAHLLFFVERTEELISIAYKVHNSYAHSNKAIIKNPGKNDPDITHTEAYTGQYANSNPWNGFPRHLTAAQYYYPYKAIRKLCKQMQEGEWKKVLRDLAEYALSNMSIDDEYTLHEILTVRKRLLQALDAFHLVHTRLANAAATEEEAITQAQTQAEQTKE